MRVAEVNTTQKRVLALDKIKGVDLTSSPSRVKDTRASYMKNMICKGGVNHKRNGFEQVAVFFDEEHEPERINGIFPFQKDGEKSKIVHAGKSLYKCSNDYSLCEKITIGNIYGEEPGSGLKDEKSQGFTFDRKLYLKNGSSLLVYDGEKVEDLYRSEGAYVPTTSIGITDELHGALLEPYEGVNLFSIKRINKLIGEKDDSYKELSAGTKVWDIQKSSSRFFLDGAITSDVKITATINAVGMLQHEATMPLLCTIDGENTTGTVEITFEKDESSIDGCDYIGIGKMKGSGKTVDGFRVPYEIGGEYPEITLKARIANKNGQGILSFTPALVSPALGEDNITVEYTVTANKPKIKHVCELNAGSKNKTLAILTEEDMIYFSSPIEGYSFFPDNSYIKAQDDVVALVPGNGFLGVASEKEISTVALSLDTSGERINIAASLASKHSDIGCIAPFSASYLEGDSLFVSNKGVYGLTASDVYFRSTNIEKELVSFDKAFLRGAVGVEHDGRYYLFIDNNVYIADARYKTYESNRLDVSYEYEWWRWEDLSCSFALNDEGTLVLGREDGRIMKLGEMYSDITTYELMDTEWNYEDEKFSFSDELDMKNKKVIINNACMIFAQGQIRLVREGGKAFLSFSEKDFFDLKTNGRFSEKLAVLITSPTSVVFLDEFDVNDSEQEIIFAHQLELSTDVIVTDAILYKIFENEEMFVKEIDGGYEIIDACEKKFIPASITDVIDSWEMKIKRLNYIPVECEMHTAALLLSNDGKKRTLHKLVFVPSQETSGEVLIGYETNKTNKMNKQVISGSLDFGEMDFYNFSFDADFYKLYEKRIHERNVEAVKFKFKSSSDGDFAIESFSCLCSINER